MSNSYSIANNLMQHSHGKDLNLKAESENMFPDSSSSGLSNNELFLQKTSYISKTSNISNASSKKSVPPKKVLSRESFSNAVNIHSSSVPSLPLKKDAKSLQKKDVDNQKSSNKQRSKTNKNPSNSISSNSTSKEVEKSGNKRPRLSSKNNNKVENKKTSTSAAPVKKRVYTKSENYIPAHLSGKSNLTGEQYKRNVDKFKEFLKIRETRLQNDKKLKAATKDMSPKSTSTWASRNLSGTVF